MLTVTLFLATPLTARNDSIHYKVDLSGTASSGDFAPFWFQSMHFGKVLQHPFSNNLGMSVYKNLSNQNALFDYGFNADVLLRTNYADVTEAYFHQLYAQARFWIFDLSIGAKEMQHGFHHRELSAGSYLFSQNARPIPGITAGIEEFRTIPFTYDLLEIKGGLTQGWFADQVYAPDIMLHHKYMYLRLGGKFPVRLQYGLDHAAQWGGAVAENPNPKFNLRDFKKIFLGKSGGEDTHLSEQINALGNHIISIHAKLEVNLPNTNIDLYWQTLSEDGPIRLLPWLAPNWRDGLWGIALRNKNFPYLKGFVYEFISTLDQSGPWHDKDGIVYGGGDSYFTNGIYHNDWTHFGRTIGTPLVLSPVLNKDGSARIFYNDLRAHHIGINGTIAGFDYRLLGTYSQYYINNEPPPMPNFFWMLEAGKKIEKWADTELLLSLGGNVGEIPGKTTGIKLSIRKTGTLFPR